MIEGLSRLTAHLMVRSYVQVPKNLKFYDEVVEHLKDFLERTNFNYIIEKNDIGTLIIKEEVKRKNIRKCTFCRTRIEDEEGNCIFEYAETPEGYIVCADCDMDYREGKFDESIEMRVFNLVKEHYSKMKMSNKNSNQARLYNACEHIIYHQWGFLNNNVKDLLLEYVEEFIPLEMD